MAIKKRYALTISIHAPREGSDSDTQADLAEYLDFYPRSPRGERPIMAIKKRYALTISIHAPREGSDPDPAPRDRVMALNDFYPRSPRGERPKAMLSARH